MIDFKLIDDSEELNLQLLDDNEEIKLEMTDYDDTEVKEMIDEVDNKVDNLSSQVNHEINEIEADLNELDGRVRINTNNISNLQQTKADKTQVNALSNRVDQIPIVTKTSQLTNDSGFITKDVNNLTYYTTTANLSRVALTGNYNDLTNKPNLSNFATTAELGNETTARENADIGLQGQIDAITSSSDVKDIVGTYIELQNYDTSTLGNDDIIKVLQDSTHNEAMTYYRWVISGSSGSWQYIGQEGPYYTKSETETLLNNKQDEITSLNKLDSDLVDDTNQTNKFVTENEKTTWNNKLDSSDLTDYVKNTDIATSSKAGLIKINDFYGVENSTDGGTLRGRIFSYADYQQKNNFTIMSKGTLEYVITGKGLIDNTYYSDATTTTSGLMSSNDKIELIQNTNNINGIENRIAFLTQYNNALSKNVNIGETLSLNNTIDCPMPIILKANDLRQIITTGKNKFDQSTFAPGYYIDDNLDTRVGSRQSYYMESGSYTFSTDLDLNIYKYYIVTLASPPPSRPTNYNSNWQSTATFTFTLDSSQAGYVCVIISRRDNGNISINDMKPYNFQIEEGTTATEYEIYTNGEPTPTISYPQNISTITGNNIINIKNSDETQIQTYNINLGDLTYCKMGNIEDIIFKNIPIDENYDNTLEFNKWYLKKYIGKIDSYNGETITTAYQSTTGGLNTGSLIYYVLNEPINILLNDTLQNGLNKLEYSMSYDGTTNISQVNDEVPFILQTETFNALQAQIDALEARIEALENS